MTAADWIIRWTIAGAVVGVAAVASYEHAYALVRAHGEAGWTGHLVPLTVDGLIYASSLVIIRGAYTLAAAPRQHAAAPVIDPLGKQAAVVFAAELAADRVPSVRAIRAALHVGQPRAQRLREFLAAADTDGEGLAA